MFSLFKYLDVNLNKDTTQPSNSSARTVWFTIPTEIVEIEEDGIKKTKYGYISFPINSENDSDIVEYELDTPYIYNVKYLY